MTDAELAADIAEEAGRLLIELQEDGGISGKALGDAGDVQANALILARLRAERPDDAILSEESDDDRSRLGADRCWIIDPLDGTREYAERRDDWAVHVGLSVGGRAETGAVALPARNIVLKSNAALPIPGLPDRPRVITSRTRPAPVAEFAAETLGFELLRLGSAGAKVGAVLLGEADAYLHSGAQREWDNCAPVAVALAAGLHCSRLDGSALRYNREDVIVPDLLICRKELAEPLLAAAADFSRRSTG